VEHLVVAVMVEQALRQLQILVVGLTLAAGVARLLVERLEQAVLVVAVQAVWLWLVVLPLQIQVEVEVVVQVLGLVLLAAVAVLAS
jgi:hypothetical protein